MRNFRSRLAAVWERGCGILTILLITLPLWVMTLAFRGPLFAIGALAVLFAVVIGFGAIGRWLNRDR